MRVVWDWSYSSLCSAKLKEEGDTLTSRGDQIFLKRILRSSQSKLANEELFLEAGTSLELALLEIGMQGLGEGTEHYASEKEGVSRLMGFILESLKNEVR